MAEVSSEPVVVTTEELEVAETSEDVPGTEPSLRLVVVTGMSGAGRSTAANALEDLGWYVVDNLPPTVLPEVCDAGQAERHPPARRRARRPDPVVLRAAADACSPS